MNSIAIGMIRPTETREVRAVGTDYASAKAALQREVPEGWQLLWVKVREVEK